MAIAHSLQDIIEQLSRGQTISFGKLHIDLEGLTVADKQLSWIDLASIEVTYGDSAPPVVLIYEHGWRSHADPELWAMLSANQVTNLPLLLMITGELGYETCYASA